MNTNVYVHKCILNKFISMQMYTYTKVCVYKYSIHIEMYTNVYISIQIYSNVYKPILTYKNVDIIVCISQFIVKGIVKYTYINVQKCITH